MRRRVCYRRGLSNFSVLLLFVAASACASNSTTTNTGAGTAATTNTSRRPVAPRRDRDVITQLELSEPSLRALSVYDVIRALRPNFFNVRGRVSRSDPEAGQVHASFDYNGVVPLTELRNIHAGGVLEIRYLDAAAAMQRFGGSSRQGPVIVVKTQ